MDLTREAETKKDSDYKVELLSLKKEVADFYVLGMLQDILSMHNDMVVRCGCSHCLDLGGNNYIQEDGRPYEAEPHTVEVKNCLLYAWFKGRCSEFSVILPDDSIDHPCVHPRTFNLTYCLGKSQWDRRDSETHWFDKVRNLSYEDQLKSVYKMLHSMTNELENEKDQQSWQTFMTFAGKSLLPT
jgi:hypothetical protein